MRPYSVKSVFLTFQGEGAWAGHKAVFLRLAGCNAWSGRPEDRNRGAGACALWCDTDFARGAHLDIHEVVARMNSLWHEPAGRFCVITGGEPLLQLDEALVRALHRSDWRVAVETNGSVKPEGWDDWGGLVDHVTVSPKMYLPVKLAKCDELKVVLPGAVNANWSDLELLKLHRELEPLDSFVQPMDPGEPAQVESTALHPRTALPPLDHAALRVVYDEHLRLCQDFVMRHPEFRLGLQLHKFAGVP